MSNILGEPAVSKNSNQQPVRRQYIAGSHSIPWLLISLVVVIFDQFTKDMVVQNLIEFQRINLLPVLDLVRFHNTGAAFSFLANLSYVYQPQIGIPFSKWHYSVIRGRTIMNDVST